MSGFGNILERGKHKFNSKQNGRWDKCENCEQRKFVYTYLDKEQAEWTVCEDCLDKLSKEEEND